MREIKFRGKNYLTNEWIYGGINLSCLPQWCFIICDNNCEVVQEDTIGQYTGLKDKNGKEIYEGDIVQILGGEYEQGFYEWDERVQIKDLIYDGFNLMMTISQIGKESVEVIGNIYDNPELLKEE